MIGRPQSEAGITLAPRLSATLNAQGLTRSWLVSIFARDVVPLGSFSGGICAGYKPKLTGHCALIYAVHRR